MSKFEDYTTPQLHEELTKYQAKIDGPENDGRLTTSSSAALDFWMEMVEELADEIKRREGERG